WEGARTAADMGMGNVGASAGLEHAGTGGDLDKPAVRIADAHEPAAALPSPADEPGEEHGRHRGCENPGEGVDDRVQGAPGLRRRERHAGECFSRPIRIGGEGYDL